MEQPTNQIESVKNVFDREDVKKKFQDMLGSKATGFMVSVINAVSNNDKLKDANRNSVLFAAATAASLDLPIDPNLGFAYIIPYNKKIGKNEKGIAVYETLAQFQMGYKGFVQLAQRSGQFRTISASAIYNGQLVELNPLAGPRFDFTIKGNKIVGYAAYMELINGFQKTLYMTVEELKEHGLKYSKSFKQEYGLWVDNFDAMAQKTVIKLLLSKWAPLSIEMQKAVQLDQSVVNDWDGTDPKYVDNKTEKVLLEDIIGLYDAKKEVCTKEEQKMIARIIDNKEEANYPKVKLLLSEK